MRDSRIYRAFKAAVVRYKMVVPGDRVLAACSGGPDSTALVLLLMKLRDEMSFEVCVAHFNHKLRAAAGEDERFVRNMTRRRGLPLVTASRDVRGMAAKRKINLEEAGRTLRYEFLQKSAAEIKATKIATGHTLNDQAETFLMRLMRGTGLTGLAGVAPVVAGGPCPVVRPLLEVKRQDIEAFLRGQGVPFREDESNLDRRYLRNRVRLDLLPRLERDYEPRIVEHLARLASLVRDEEELFAGISRELAAEFILRRGREIWLDARTLTRLPLGLARRVVREYLREVKGDLRAVSFSDVEALLGLGDGKEKSVARGLAFRRERGLISLKPKPQAAPAYEILWDGVGDLAVGPAGLTFRGRTTQMPKVKAPRRADLGESAASGRRKGARPEALSPASLPFRGDDRNGARFDFGKLRFPILVRNRRPGDRYRPLGAPGRKKIKEIMRAKGLPANERNRLPVFLSGGEIIWIPGLPVAEAFRVAAKTKRIFLVEKI